MTVTDLQFISFIFPLLWIIVKIFFKKRILIQVQWLLFRLRFFEFVWRAKQDFSIVGKRKVCEWYLATIKMNWSLTLPLLWIAKVDFSYPHPRTHCNRLCDLHSFKLDWLYFAYWMFLLQQDEWKSWKDVGFLSLIQIYWFNEVVIKYSVCFYFFCWYVLFIWQCHPSFVEI